MNMRDELIATFRKWLALDDADHIDVIVAAVLSIMFPGDPCWLLVVSPPGGGKTEIIRSLSGDYIYSLDTMTSKTLVSGLTERDKHGVITGAPKQFGILQDLKDKVLVIKDLTTMLPNQYTRGEENVFNQLRAAYDGEYAAAHGSGQKRQYFRTKFGVIAAVTPVIDRTRNVQGALGERFITVRIRTDATKAIYKAQENSGQEDTMRKELQTIMVRALQYYKAIGDVEVPRLPDTDLNKIRHLADLTARLRTDVPRDYLHMILSVPESEVGTRLTKQFTRLAEMLALFDAYDYKKLTKVARDSLNPMRLSVLETLYTKVKAHAYGIHLEIGLNDKTVAEICDDLHLLNICNIETIGRAKYYSFKDEIWDLIMESEIFTPDVIAKAQASTQKAKEAVVVNG